jgi:putative membrane protein
MLLRMPHRRFLFLLTVLLGFAFVVLAIVPNDRKDWLLENVLVALCVGAMFASYRKLTLSRIS